MTSRRRERHWLKEIRQAAKEINEIELELPEAPRIDSPLRHRVIHVPGCIQACSGIVVFGRRIRSLAFTTDLAIIRNINADAILAVYPFTPQPIISEMLIRASDVPVFSGVGGGITQGKRVVDMAQFAEMQGASGVVVNVPTTNETIERLVETLDVPVIVTVLDEQAVEERLRSGAAILNVAAAYRTPEVVRKIRRKLPEVPIMATGGPTEESIKETILAGANAITWTPPSPGDIFEEIMNGYRTASEQKD